MIIKKGYSDLILHVNLYIDNTDSFLCVLLTNLSMMMSSVYFFVVLMNIYCHTMQYTTEMKELLRAENN